MKDVQIYENIVYPGVSEGTRFPNFGKILNEETLRFRDNVNNDPESQCLRGSIAQYDQYEALDDDNFLFFFDFNALTVDLTVFFEVNPSYSARICLTDELDTCFSPIERCEILLTTEGHFEGADGPYRVVSAKDFGFFTDMHGTDFDDVLVARKG